MEQAEADLKAMKPDEALAPEQRALKILQDAEQQYETQIAAAAGRRRAAAGSRARWPRTWPISSSSSSTSWRISTR